MLQFNKKEAGIILQSLRCLEEVKAEHLKAGDFALDEISKLADIFKELWFQGGKDDSFDCCKCGHHQEVRPNTFCDECGFSNA